MPLSTLTDAALRRLNLATGRLHALPILVLMPHSSCNCRCVMCDIWKANKTRTQLTPEDLQPHLEDIRRLRVRWIVLSGGEALLHSNLWALCAPLRRMGIRLTLLSTGLLLARHAEDVVRNVDEVVVSLDGSRAVHDRIRNVPRAFERLAEGVAALKTQAPAFRVTARCVVQRSNVDDLSRVVDAAQAMGLDGVSFLAADVFSSAFNRPEPWSPERAAEVGLTEAETETLSEAVEELIARHAAAVRSGYVAEPPAKLRALPRYFAAALGKGDFPVPVCNAPWTSAVVEADGTVRPCFFHAPLGNLHEASLARILNGPAAITFRNELDVRDDATCRRCTCSLYLSPLAALPAPGEAGHA